jgi:hypothetical protein
MTTKKPDVTKLPSRKNSISQREARELRREVQRLHAEEDRRRNSWVSEWPGGTNIAQSSFNAATDFLPAVIHNSRKLGHAVICTTDGSTVLYYALPLASVKL